MRAKRARQRSLFDAGYPDHQMGRGLAAISAVLDQHPEFVDWIAEDVDRGGRSFMGRAGLPCEVILRCGILKHLWQSDYRELEFVLADSASARRFTRIDPLRPPKRSALQRCIRAVRAETWERINRALLGTAKDDRIETGHKVRIDSTVTETHILEPSDSQLLYDAVRVLSRLLARGREKLGPDAFPFHDHRRAAKRRKWKIPKARMKRKVKLYRELLAVVRRTSRYADGALAAVEGREEPWLDDWRTQVAHYRDLAGKVVSQTVRRVLKGETVSAEEKVVSLFEFHTDIIRKGGRRVQYGHKVNLGSGASGLVFDAVVEAGNPADSSRCLPMIERHAAIYGSMPQQVAFDGGYASKANLADAKALACADATPNATDRDAEGLAAGGQPVSADECDWLSTPAPGDANAPLCELEFREIIRLEGSIEGVAPDYTDFVIDAFTPDGRLVASVRFDTLEETPRPMSGGLWLRPTEDELSVVILEAFPVPRE